MHLADTVPTAITVELDWGEGGLTATELRDALGTAIDGDAAENALAEICPWTWNLSPRLAGLGDNDDNGPYALHLTTITIPRRAS
ncbi:hypothetical protein IU436_29820 [Nocardia farcinica]|uniref:hypothetical protein n=1 Tax=Nocardia TaxID=1817 RepID=UPI00189612DC|nr:MULTISPECIES: hypothetical protein [Nocardia]MBF6216401.1 hypothetical protein [Nocardia puris]MBF6422908.1 hypothetical protein [Nocardia farcinica]MBF6434519.1 hypothetical protein [Nocardia farcinica]MBF6505604.1 hypothetical protein [Nocardia farcinica]